LATADSARVTSVTADEPGGESAWISRAEVAENDFVAFTSKRKADQVPGRLVVRRIPDLNTEPGQGTLFEQWRHHAFFTTTSAEVADTVAADKIHRGHAIIEQVHADLKDSALAHLPSGSSTTTPPGWCSRSWRSTSPAPPESWADHSSRGRPPAPSAAN
jgi:hypothetical protein